MKYIGVENFEGISVFLRGEIKPDGEKKWGGFRKKGKIG